MTVRVKKIRDFRKNTIIPGFTMFFLPYWKNLGYNSRLERSGG